MQTQARICPLCKDDHEGECTAESEPRVVCWFSCGITSAVAAKLAVERYPDRDVRIVYCDTRSEHSDNMRFLLDCEEWFGHKIERIGSEKYHDIWDVWEKTGWLVGPRGTRCTVELKKKIRLEYQKPDDLQVFGFDPSEPKRVAQFKDTNHELDLWFPLVESGITKVNAAEIIMRAGIELPEMYRLGFRHANCPGCPLGQQGYWNKIRVVFPEVFERMAKLERKMDVAINKSYAGDKLRKRVFLDELDPDVGNYETEPVVECGLSCGVQESLL